MQAGIKAWHDGIDWWTQPVHGNRSEVNDVVERFNSQARSWYGQMQQVAAQFAGQDAGAGDVARAWKQALGRGRREPFPGNVPRDARAGTAGPRPVDRGRVALPRCLEARRRVVAGHAGVRLRTRAPGAAAGADAGAARLPGQDQRLQRADDEVGAARLRSVRGQAGRARRTGPAAAVSARAMFDLWIDSAEEAYAEIALSPEFRKVYGGLVNAQMRVRAGMQKEVEQMSEKLGMPTRSEVDSAHRKIAELERQLRRMRDAAQAPPRKPRHRSRPRRPCVAAGRRRFAQDRRRSIDRPAPRRGEAAGKTQAKAAPPRPAATTQSRQRKPTTKGKR